MNKQDLLNTFLFDFGKFIESYYSRCVSEIIYEKSFFCKIIIKGFKESDTLEILTDAGEITCLYNYSHWHIDDYNKPCQLENIYEQTINSAFSVLNSEIVSYDVFYNDEILGGGSNSNKIETIISDCRNSFKSANKIKLSKWNEDEKVVMLWDQVKIVT